MDLVGNLGGDLVKREGRDRADDAMRQPSRYRHEVRPAERRQRCPTVDTTAEPLDDALVPETIEGARVDTELYGS